MSLKEKFEEEFGFTDPYYSYAEFGYDQAIERTQKVLTEMREQLDAATQKADLYERRFYKLVDNLK